MSGVTVWQMRPRTASPLPGPRLAAREFRQSLHQHRLTGIAVLLAAGVAAIAVAVLMRPLAVASLTLSGPGRLLDGAASAVRSRPLQLQALRSLGIGHVFPGLSSIAPDDRGTALDRLTAALTVRRTQDGLDLAVRLPDPATAAALVQALADATLAPGLANGPAEAISAAGPSPALLGERDRLDAEAAEEARAGARLSASLTDITRDMVAGLRLAASQPAAEGMLQEAGKLLAELQVHRIELAAKYQPDFPPLAATDAEIAQVQHFVDTARRGGRARPDPGFALLAGERARVAAELADLDRARERLRARRAAIEARLSAPAPQAGAPLAVGVAALSVPPDRRVPLIAAILLIGAAAAFAAQFARLRRRRSFATAAEVEAVLHLPVLHLAEAEAPAAFIGRPPADLLAMSRAGPFAALLQSRS